MNVSFPNPTHVTSVWVPELMPTHMTVLSMLVGLLFCSVLLTAVGVMFFVACLERSFSWLRTIVAGIAIFALLVGGGLLSNRLLGTNAVEAQLPTLTKHEALQHAKRAAVPSYAWRERAKQVSAQGRLVQKGWSAEDMHQVSVAVEQAKGFKAASPYPKMVISSGPLTNAQLAKLGTSYYVGTQKQRCAVWLNDVVHNNVGQPLSAKISSLRCVPVS